MKKVILVLLFVFSLNADQYACDYYYTSFTKDRKMFDYAVDRNDYDGMILYNRSMLENIEKSITECSDPRIIAVQESMREIVLRTYKVLNGIK